VASASGESVGITRNRVRVTNSRTTADVITVSVWFELVRVANSGIASVRVPGGR
jgi:hypothetical protein